LELDAHLSIVAGQKLSESTTKRTLNPYGLRPESCWK